MTTRQRIALLIAVIVVGSSGLLAAAGLAAGGPVRTPAPVDRVQRFYAVGPSAEYESDFGSIGVVDPLHWTVPDDMARTAVVEVSVQYSTKGHGPFVMTMDVRDAHRHRLTLRPNQ